MRRKDVLGLLMFSTVLFQGCSPMTVLRTHEIEAVRDSLKKEIGKLEKKIEEFRQEQGELLRLIRADQQVRLEGLEKQVGELSSGLSESQDRLSKIDEIAGEVQRQLQARHKSDSLSSGSRKEQIGRLFKVAMKDFTAGRFDMARKGFRDLATKFPESERGKESEYWAGECLYAKKAHADAEKEFLQYIKKYPDGTKACVALFKLGMCYEKMKKEKSRDVVWKKLIEKCPDSQEALNVKSRGK